MNRATIKVPTFTRAAVLRLGAAAAGALVLVILGCEILNNPPNINIVIQDDTPLTGSTQTLTAVVEDLDEDLVIITWSATDGEFTKTTGEVVKWTAPTTTGRVLITAVADDRKAGGTDTATVALSVVNAAPSITEFTSSAPYVTLGNSVTLSCEAFDPDAEDITYDFFTSPYGVGAILHDSPEISTATWIAPVEPILARTYDIIVKVQDIPQGYFSTDTLQVLVFSEHGTIWIVDSVYPRVSKYTARGEKVLSAGYSFKKPVAVANNIDEFYGCYVADHDDGQIVKLDEKGENVVTFPSMPNVIDLAIHRETRTLWAISVSDEEPRLTVINTSTGSVIKQIEGLRLPSAITINQDRHEVWISDYGETDRVIQINIGDQYNLPDSLTSANATIFEGNYDSPSSLSVRNAEDATVYIADMTDDGGEIERLIYNPATGNYYRGTPVSLGNERGPSKVRVADAGLVWVLNIDRSILFFPENNPSQQTPIGSYPFSDPHAMAIDRVTGNVWIGDNGRHQVIEISSADVVGVTISGFSFVEDIVVNK